MWYHVQSCSLHTVRTHCVDGLRMQVEGGGRGSMCAGSIVDMKELGVWEPLAVKSQTIKTAVESATLLLRIDDIVSGMSKREKPAPGQAKGPQTEDPDQVLSVSLMSPAACFCMSHRCSDFVLQSYAGIFSCKGSPSSRKGCIAIPTMPFMAMCLSLIDLV